MRQKDETALETNEALTTMREVTNLWREFAEAANAYEVALVDYESLEDTDRNLETNKEVALTKLESARDRILGLSGGTAEIALVKLAALRGGLSR